MHAPANIYHTFELKVTFPLFRLTLVNFSTLQVLVNSPSFEKALYGVRSTSKAQWLGHIVVPLS
jgi:hypothetical protein